MTYILITLLLNIIIFIFYYRKKYGVFTPPLVFTYVFIFIFFPQLTSIYYSDYYDNRYLPLFCFIIVSSNLACAIGFEQGLRKKVKRIREIRLERFININLAFSCLGFLTIFMWGGEYDQTGDNVIPVMLKTFSRISFTFCLVYILKGEKSKKMYFSLILSSLVLLNYTFFLKGSRIEGLFLLFNLAFFCCMYFKSRRKGIKLLTISCLIIGAIASSMIHQMRTSFFKTKQKNINVLEQFDYLQGYLNSFKQDRFDNGMDLGNAYLGIQYVFENNEYDFGVQFWNYFVQNFVPRRLVGEKIKSELLIDFDYVDFVENVTMGITTMTGYFNAFTGFSVYAFVLFYLLGFIYGSYWNKAKYSNFYLFMVLYFTPVLVSILTLAVHYFLTTFVFLLFLYFLISPIRKRIFSNILIE